MKYDLKVSQRRESWAISRVYSEQQSDVRRPRLIAREDFIKES
jgi:hypothetical protein